jgi:catechol 2,3-dioxygenase-like lactoylglutathione lyase family enzyme
MTCVHHLGITVRDIERSYRFYRVAFERRADVLA